MMLDLEGLARIEAALGRSEDTSVLPLSSYVDRRHEIATAVASMQRKSEGSDAAARCPHLSDKGSL